MAVLLITREFVSSLTKRGDFYDRLPEFRALKNIPTKQGGCSGCRGSKHKSNLYNAFRQVLSGLTADAKERFKTYVGQESVQFIGYNPSTRRTETITI